MDVFDEFEDNSDSDSDDDLLSAKIPTSVRNWFVWYKNRPLHYIRIKACTKNTLPTHTHTHTHTHTV